MEYAIKYEKRKGLTPWSVYGVTDDAHIYKKGCLTRMEAEEWIEAQPDYDANGPSSRKRSTGEVEEASIESFPASDPPAWTHVAAK